MDGIQYQILSEEADVNFGAVYENFVAQELASKGFPFYYYNSDARGAEFDFKMMIREWSWFDGMMSGIDHRNGSEAR